MLRLVLTRSLGGEFALWERRREGAQYIIACDPAQGRVSSEHSDTCCIGAWLRKPGGGIAQAAEVVFRWTGGRQGECIGALGRYYGSHLDHAGRERGNAIVNIERNQCDVQLHTLLETQAFPDEYLFVPREDRDLLIERGVKRFFTSKTTATQDYILNTMIDYLEQDLVEVRSEPTLNEIRTLHKNDKGRVDTNGKDRAMMVAIACVTDRELGPVDYTELAPLVAEKKVLEFGRIPPDPEKKKKSAVPHRAKWAPWLGGATG